MDDGQELSDLQGGGPVPKKHFQPQIYASLEKRCNGPHKDVGATDLRRVAEVGYDGVTRLGASMVVA